MKTLSVFDKLKFIKKQYVQNHKSYINDGSHTTHDVLFVSHENMYPKWYTPPFLTRMDENGIRSYFNSDNEYITDGWAGDTITQSEFGEYKIDEQTGEQYFEQAYSDKAATYYQVQDSLVSLEGYLNRYSYKEPSALFLNEMQVLGYNIIEDGNIITVKNASEISVWHVNEKIFGYQKIEGTSPIETTKRYYKYYSEYDDYLLDKITMIIPATFDNGDCYEMVTVTRYTNYSTQCKTVKKDAKKNDFIEQVQMNYSDQKLVIHPNPVSNKLSVAIPKSKSASMLKVMDFAGNMLLQRKVAAGVNSYELNISNFTSGMYIIRVQQGDDHFSSKFVKQ